VSNKPFNLERKIKMKESLFNKQEAENKEELSHEKARELLDDKNISDEQLEKIINSIKIFCKVAYELYSEEENKKISLIEIETIIPLHSGKVKKAA
jgi:hypothetical protein